jgi:hypothetical protein
MENALKVSHNPEVCLMFSEEFDFKVLLCVNCWQIIPLENMEQ